MEIFLDKDRIFGKTRGKVISNKDPQKMGRILFIVPELMGSTIMPWAKPVNNQGRLPNIGEDVWIEFERGDINFPIYSGEWATTEEGTNPVPDLAKGLPDETAQGNMDQGSKGFDRMPIQGSETLFFDEPYSGFGAEYSHNRIIKTKSGNLLEIDDTPDNERIHIYHRRGSFLEYKSDGSCIKKTRGREHSIIEANHIQHIHENEYKSIDLNSRYQITKNRSVTVGNDYKKEIGGETTEIYKSSTNRSYKGRVDSEYNGDINKTVYGSERKTIGGPKLEVIMENKDATVVGRKSTVITNLNIDDEAELKTILIGNLYQKLVAGDKELLILLGDVLKKILIGNLKYNIQIGDMEFKVGTGDIEISTSADGFLDLGEITIKNQDNKIKLYKNGKTEIITKNIINLISDLINIKKDGESVEPMVLGNKIFAQIAHIVQMFLNHQHTHPYGPTTGLIGSMQNFDDYRSATNNVS